MSKPILFYSRKSNSCIELWKHLDSKNRLGDFVKICVDNNPKIPSLVTTVPSIFIKGRALISGPAIQMFLNNPQISATNRVQNARPNFGKAPNNSRALDKTPEVTSSTNNLGGILDFNPVEMGNSFSDSYSFIQDNPSPMDFCYQFIKNEKDNAITGNNQNQNRTQQNGRSSGLDQRLAQLQQQRNSFN